MSLPFFQATLQGVDQLGAAQAHEVELALQALLVPGVDLHVAITTTGIAQSTSATGPC